MFSYFAATRYEKRKNPNTAMSGFRKQPNQNESANNQFGSGLYYYITSERKNQVLGVK